MNDTGLVPLSAGELDRLDRYWRAANYLSVGQIYLLDNPLLREPLSLQHVKPRLLGHWGTTPGLNFVYAHLNRVICKHDLQMLFVCGPGHGGPAVVANVYLEGTYSEIYPEVGLDSDGIRRLFRQFSFPGGIPSHAAPETPGSIHEGGELGYALLHASGAVFDTPDLIACCVIGDGEAETGALAASWHSHRFLNPARDGAVLPVLHLNGFKIAGPTILGRMRDEELAALFTGLGYHPYFVSGSDPLPMHQAMAGVMDSAIAELRDLQRAAKEEKRIGGRQWPLIVLRSPKGWTGPRYVDGLPAEGSFRSHQVPLAGLADNPAHLRQLEEWLRSYRPEELFDGQGRLFPDLQELAPRGERRMGSNAHAAGSVTRPLEMPDFRAYAVDVVRPGCASAEATRVLGAMLRDTLRQNPDNFRIFGPDETTSNRLDAVFEVTQRVYTGEVLPGDEHLGPDGRVMEVLSEHLCQGWLEGYLLTGRHGLFSCYEAFIHIVDSMFNQHAKWLKVTRTLPWRTPLPSLNYLLTSHVWRQDHNGFSHQDPGFLDHVVNKKAEVVRVYLPPDANTLLAVADHCLRSRHYVNVIVAGKQPSPQWLSMAAAAAHVEQGLGVWEWAGTAGTGEPDVVLACAGDIPTLEMVAAADLLRRYCPDLRTRVVNVVDLMRLQSASMHPHGLSDDEFDQLFTPDRPVVFAFHGYPALIHRLTYRRRGHVNLHVHGFIEEGTTTTPFDMTVLNGVDRYHLALDALRRVPRVADGPTGSRAADVFCRHLARHASYIREHGEDMPEVREWRLEP